MSDPPQRYLSSGAHENPREPKRLEVLLLDYEMAREDERSLTNAITTTFSVAVALLGLLGAAITQHNKIPPLLLAGTPLLPLSVLAYLEMLGAQATVRTYYMRGLESELRRYAAAPITALGQLQPASYVGISAEMVSLRRGRIGYRLTVNFVLVVILVVFGGLTLYIGLYLIRSDGLRIAMAVTYGLAALLLLWEAAAGTLGGRRLFIRTARTYLDGRTKLPMVTRTTGGTATSKVTSGGKERSLGSYLLFPRPEDWVKWAIAPVIFTVTAWSTDIWRHWGRFVLVWLILEYLIYLARYQWNDVRGIDEDTIHAEQKSRGRLPRGKTSAATQRNVLISISIGLLRLVLAIAIGVTTNTAWPVLLLISVVFGIAVVYEILRASTSDGSDATSLRATPAIVAIWIVVGFGYAARASVGFSYGGLPLTSTTAIAGMACIAAYGAMFVLLTWVLDATTYCRHDVKDVADSQNQEGPLDFTWYRLETLTKKPHLGALLSFVDVKPAPEAAATELRKTISDPNDVTYCGRHKVLDRRGRVFAPWNWALLLSVMIGAVLGMSLADPSGSGPAPYLIAMTLALIGTAVITVACRNTTSRLFVVISITVAAVAAALPNHPRIPLLAAVPWLIISGTYVGFRGSSYQDLKKLGPGIKAIPSLILYLIVGRKTAATMHLRQPADQ